VQLTIAHVNGNYLAGTVFKQAISESASRSTSIKDNATGYVDGKCSKSFL
jgi:hypothetical protein